MNVREVALGKTYGDALLSKNIDGLRIWELEYGANEIIPPHKHQTPYLCFLLNGDYIESDSREEIVYSHDRVIYLPQGRTHDAHIGPEGAHVFVVEIHNGYFSSDLCVEKLPERVVKLQDRRIHNNLHYTMMIARSDAADAALAFWPHEIIAHLIPGERDNGAGWMGDVFQYIHDHAAENPTPSQIANIARRHPAHLMRAFRRITGVTLGAYIRTVKIEHACRLVRAKSKSLTEIAMLCGFADQSHFIRVFRNAIGVTPTIYRRAFQ